MSRSANSRMGIPRQYCVISTSRKSFDAGFGAFMQPYTVDTFPKMPSSQPIHRFPKGGTSEMKLLLSLFPKRLLSSWKKSVVIAPLGHLIELRAEMRSVVMSAFGLNQMTGNGFVSTALTFTIGLS